MGNWTLTGDLGSGKSIIAVGKIRDHMMSGLKCAGNMDIYPENLLPPTNKSVYLRLPDFPTADDLWSLSSGSETKNEATFGLVVLDELAVFLNSREWQGKARDMVIKYLRHVRKKHWHTIFITQDIESIDAQARRALIEHKVTCKRTDRFNIPFFGRILNFIGLNGRLPRVHIGVVRYGKSDLSPVVDTWRYMGKSHYDGYDTDQVFTEELERDIVLKPYHSDNSETYPAAVVGSFTMLSAWHVHGRYLSYYDKYKQLLQAVLILITLCGVFFSYVAYHRNVKPALPASAAAVAPTETQKAKGSMRVGNSIFLTTSKNEVVEVDYYKTVDGVTLYHSGASWFVISQ
jgi:hypothetical protein